MNWRDHLFELNRKLRAQVRRFDARPKRERLMMLLAAVALLLLAGDRFWLAPAFKHFNTASTALAAAKADQQVLADESERRRVVGESQRRELDADIAQWRQRTQQGAQALLDTQAGLIGPDRMVALLEQMLPKGGAVKIVGLKTLPPQDARLPVPAATTPRPAVALLPTAAASAASALATTLAAPAPSAAAVNPAVVPAVVSAPADGAPLYRHGVEITVEGQYADLMGYLSALEGLPGPRLLWGGIKLKVEKHPTVQLSLTVYTLSLDQAWLEL